ncbi:hypothetical protein V8E53_011076 [Lactarius tabidus]
MPSTPADANPSFPESEAAFTTIEGTTTAPAQVEGAGTSSDVRPLCDTCGKSFGRPQDVRRHIKDLHTPRRRCPFCPHEWSRPEKIKAHLTDVHRDLLSAENLQGICALRGQQVFVFLDTFAFIHSAELAQIPASLTFFSTTPSS